jgi:hypothetical protein
MKTTESVSFQTQNDQNRTKSFSHSSTKLIALLIVLVFIAIGFFAFGYLYGKSNKPNVTHNFISDKLEAVSTLTTAKLIYNGMEHYSEGKIPFINLKAFTMTYRAEITAGTDISKAKIHITKDYVEITFPKVSILNIYIDPSSIIFYDKKAALLNWKTLEDTTIAIANAENFIKDSAESQKLLEKAEEQFEHLMHALFDDQIGERKLIIRYE